MRAPCTPEGHGIPIREPSTHFEAEAVKADPVAVATSCRDVASVRLRIARSYGHLDSYRSSFGQRHEALSG